MSSAADGMMDRATASEQLRSPSELQVEWIQSPAHLGEFETGWRALWSSIPDATPFQSPDWVLPWCSHYCRDPLFCFAFHFNGTLVGLAPMFIYQGEQGFRRLLLLGTGNTDYLDVIFHPAFRKQSLRLLFAEIEKRSELWDECNLQRLRPESPLLEDIEQDEKFCISVSPQEPCPVIDLRNVSLRDADRAAPMLRKAHRYATKLGQRRPFSIEEPTVESLYDCVTAWQRLHQDRWLDKGMPGALTHEKDHLFHAEVARRMLASGMLKLYSLRIAGEIAAVLYAFQHRSCRYSYLGGFDPKYARLSIGTILLGHSIERALAERCESFDFLKGRETYKYRWGATDRPIFARTIRPKR